MASLKNKPVSNRYTRFWSKVEVKSDCECWPWIGATIRNGYGQFGVDGEVLYAHRVAYELSRGPIPKGMFVCHSCDNKWCVNPAHLWAGTHAENIRDAQAKGRMSTKGGTKKLTPEIVAALRKGEIKPLDVANSLGVNDATVYAARLGKTWKKIGRATRAPDFRYRHNRELTA